MSKSELDMLLRIADGEQNVEGEATEEKPDELSTLMAIAGPSTVAGYEKPRPYQPDVGTFRAFTHGVKDGFLMPLTVFGRDPDEMTLDEVGEKIGGFMGEMVGLGIGFIPFAAGAGAALRGVGLASRVSPAVFEFLKYSAAGTVQAAGTADELEDVPKAAGIGLLAGVAIDGFFLARAMRGRATTLPKPKVVINDSVLPDEMVGRDVLSKEIEIAPVESKQPERIVQEVGDLRQEDLSYDQVLANLAESQLETVRIPEVGDPLALMNYAQTRLPNAQILRRKVIGSDVNEVLIHNPMDEASRLTPKQISQYETEGVFEGMQVLYRGNVHYATGNPVAPGRIQIRAPGGTVVFAPLRSDITIPLSPRVLTPQSIRVGQMKNAIMANNEVGFVIPSRQGKRAIQGAIDTTEYIRVGSVREFYEANKERILQIQAGSLPDAIRQFGLSTGVKGLVEVEAGITKRIHVFDQQTVQRVVKMKTTVGKTMDDVRLGESGEILSITPSWKNGIVAPLKRQGFQEKDINSFIESYTSAEARRLESLMDSEFKNIAAASRFQFIEGCM